MANQFLVSVANAVLRDPNTGNALLFGKANITSAFTMSMAATEVRGGINNPLLYVFYHDKKLEIKIEEAVFDKVLLGINAGTLVQNGVVTVTQTDCLVLSSSGSATVTQTPTSNVTVFLPDGTAQTVVPAGSNITVSGGASQKVDAIYTTTVSADQITVQTTVPPSVVDCTLLAEVRDNTGVVVNYLQIQIPRFQVSGNYSLSLAANGVSNQALDGMALAVASTDCVSGEYYAKVTWIPASGTTIPISYIASVPSTINVSIASGLPATRNITVLGIRGGIYANANITTSCSFVVTGSSVGAITVGLHTGLVTLPVGTSGSAFANIAVTYYDPTNGSLIDQVKVIAAP
jgi:hypothetical protein